MREKVVQRAPVSRACHTLHPGRNFMIFSLDICSDSGHVLRVSFDSLHPLAGLAMRNEIFMQAGDRKNYPMRRAGENTWASRIRGGLSQIAEASVSFASRRSLPFPSRFCQL